MNAADPHGLTQVLDGSGRPAATVARLILNLPAGGTLPPATCGQPFCVNAAHRPGLAAPHEVAA